MELHGREWPKGRNEKGREGWQKEGDDGVEGGIIRGKRGVERK